MNDFNSFNSAPVFNPAAQIVLPLVAAAMVYDAMEPQNQSDQPISKIEIIFFSVVLFFTGIGIAAFGLLAKTDWLPISYSENPWTDIPNYLIGVGALISLGVIALLCLEVKSSVRAKRVALKNAKLK